jgi:hypothetical protein
MKNFLQVAFGALSNWDMEMRMIVLMNRWLMQ